MTWNTYTTRNQETNTVLYSTVLVLYSYSVPDVPPDIYTVDNAPIIDEGRHYKGYIVAADPNYNP